MPNPDQKGDPGYERWPSYGVAKGVNGWVMERTYMGDTVE